MKVSVSTTFPSSSTLSLSLSLARSLARARARALSLRGPTPCAGREIDRATDQPTNLKSPSHLHHTSNSSTPTTAYSRTHTHTHTHTRTLRKTPVSWRYLRRTEGQEQPHTQRRGNSADNADASKDTFRVPDVFLLERDGWKGGGAEASVKGAEAKETGEPRARAQTHTRRNANTATRVSRQARTRSVCRLYIYMIIYIYMIHM